MSADLKKLKPCPFCRQARTRFTTEPSFDGVGKYMRLECIDCRSGTMSFHFYEDDIELRQHLKVHWNRRTPSAELEQTKADAEQGEETDAINARRYLQLRKHAGKIGQMLWRHAPWTHEGAAENQARLDLCLDEEFIALQSQQGGQ